MDESKILEEKSTIYLNQAAFMHNEGVKYLDSARSISNYIQNNPNTNFSQNLSKLESYYTTAYSFIAQADSFAILSESVRELSVQKVVESYRLLGFEVEVSRNTVSNATSQNIIPAPVQVSQETQETHETTTETTATTTQTENVIVHDNRVTVIQQSTETTNQYVIQLGAGNMSMRYFEKVPDIVVVNCKDGIKRFVLPDVYTREEAAVKQTELLELGYKQIFIRTKESLEKIRN
ncbi:MAG: hypothetical protein PHT69_04785 [Bacteroidales bacterium]|nr:hypothetical protein [Bacteroidales bacterium]